MPLHSLFDKMTARCAVAAVAVALCLAAVTRAEEQVIRLPDVSFFTGHWVAAEEGSAYEEFWFDARDGVMSGTFRWPDAGGSGRYVLELLTFVEEPDGLVFYFKHFDPKIDAWEEEPNTYDVASVSDRCARLELVNENPRVPQVMRYCMLDEDTLEFRGSDGETPVEESDFRLLFKRQD